MNTDAFSDFGLSKEPMASGDGAAWGLASFGLGAVALLTAPVILILNLLLWQAARSGPLVGLLTLILSVLGVSTMLGLAGSSIAFGLRGRRLAHGNRQQSPLAWAGILVGVAAGIGWIIVSIQILMILLS
jgi:hypothetical protein